MPIQVIKTESVQQDFRAQVGEAVLEGMLKDGIFSMSLSGVAGPSVEINLPQEHVSTLIDFLTGVRAQATVSP